MGFTNEFDERQTTATLAVLGMARSAVPFSLAGTTQQFIDLMLVVACREAESKASPPAFSVLDLNFFAPAGAAEAARAMAQLPAACGFKNPLGIDTVDGRAQVWTGLCKWLSGQPSALVVPFGATVSVDTFVQFVIKLAPPQRDDAAVIKHILAGVQSLIDSGSIKNEDGDTLTKAEDYDSVFSMIWTDVVAAVLKGDSWGPAQALADIDAAAMIVGSFREIDNFDVACPTLAVPSDNILSFKNKSQKKFRWAVTQLLESQIAPGVRKVAGMEPAIVINRGLSSPGGSATGGSSDVALAVVAGMSRMRQQPRDSDKAKFKDGTKIDPDAYLMTIQNREVIAWFGTITPTEKSDPGMLLTRLLLNSNIVKFLWGSQVEQIDSKEGQLVFAARLYLEECVKAVAKEYIHDRDKDNKGAKWVRGILLLSTEAFTGDLSLYFGGIHVRSSQIVST